MAFTHSLSYAYNTPGDSITANVSVSAEQETRMDVAIGASSDQLVAYVLDYSQCKGFFMLADQDMTVETNSASVPDQTISLKANVPYAWIYSTGGSACPITTDITALYVTAAVAGTLKLRSLVDPTV